LKNFEVRFYAGYKGKETPRSVFIGDREFRIDKILGRKRVQDVESGEVREEFTCQMEGTPARLTFHASGEWELTFLDVEG